MPRRLLPSVLAVAVALAACAQQGGGPPAAKQQISLHSQVPCDAAATPHASPVITIRITPAGEVEVDPSRLEIAAGGSFEWNPTAGVESWAAVVPDTLVPPNAPTKFGSTKGQTGGSARAQNYTCGPYKYSVSASGTTPGGTPAHDVADPEIMVAK